MPQHSWSLLSPDMALEDSRAKESVCVGGVSWHPGNQAESKCIFEDISLHAAPLLRAKSEHSLAPEQTEEKETEARAAPGRTGLAGWGAGVHKSRCGGTTVSPNLTKSPQAQLHIWRDSSKALSPEKPPSAAQPLLPPTAPDPGASLRSPPLALKGS